MIIEPTRHDEARIAITARAVLADFLDDEQLAGLTDQSDLLADTAMDPIDLFDFLVHLHESYDLVPDERVFGEIRTLAQLVPYLGVRCREERS